MNEISLKKKYDDNGNIIEEAYYSGDIRHGITSIFHPSGYKHSEIEFKNGKKDGKLVQWFEDGRKQIEAEFKDGQYHGNYCSWWENGNLKEKGRYQNGKRVGKYLWYKDDGTLWNENIYIDKGL